MKKQIKEETTRYYREELKKLREKIKQLETYMRGFKDCTYYLGGKR